MEVWARVSSSPGRTSRSLPSLFPARILSSISTTFSVPTRHGTHLPHDSFRKKRVTLAATASMSVPSATATRAPLPPAAHLDQLGRRRPHRDIVHAGALDVARHRHDLEPLVSPRALGLPPLGPVLEDRRDHGEGFDVVDERGLRPEAARAGVRRLVPRLAALVLEGFEERRLLPKDVAAWREEDLDVEALAQEAPPERLADRALERPADVLVLVAEVDPAALGADHARGQAHALHDQVRQLLQEDAVLERSGLALVGVADDVLWRRRLLPDQFPLEPRLESRPAHSPEASGLERRDHLIRGLGPRLIGRERLATLSVRIHAPLAGRRGGLAVFLGMPGHVGHAFGGDGADGDAIDHRGGGPVAAAEAGDLLDLHVLLAIEKRLDLRAPRLAAGEEAGDVAAECDLHAGRRRCPEMGVEGDDLLEAVERHAQPLGGVAQVFLAKISALSLEPVQLGEEAHFAA